MMPEIKFKVSEDLPIEIIKFEIEKELNLKIGRLERIKQAVNALRLTNKDINKFGAARQKAWEKTKKKHAL
ncbi:MAG: hypothetical protein ABIH42_05440 [Planctomycetota bacterium]